jgi:DtxR family transcriptional regulator, Mn-dependent transcriptional regulator
MEDSKCLCPLSSAMEDYLEAIYHLEQEHRIARVRDIADRLKVRMSSVTSALRTLSARGLLKYDPHQYITLTEEGARQAQDIVRRHVILKRFLVRVLKIDNASAEDNACRIEHHLDPEVIERLVDFLGFMEMCPVDQTRWVYGIAESCDDCETCLEKAKGKLRTRARAQEAAVAGGMTLAEAIPGSQVLIESLPRGSAFSGLPAMESVDIGAIVEIEHRDDKSGSLQVNVKGYRLSLDEEHASRILVKPI